MSQQKLRSQGRKQANRSKMTIRALRTTAGLSQGELAGKMGVSAMTVSNWETGKYAPNAEQTVQLQKILRMRSTKDNAHSSSHVSQEDSDAGQRNSGKNKEPKAQKSSGTKPPQANIRELRNKAGFSQGELAAKIGVSAMTVSNWETGRYAPKADQTEQLQKILGIPSAEDDITDASPFAAWVTKARNSRGLSVPELANQSGLTTGAIYRIESGVTRNLHSRTQQKLEKALGPMPEFMAEEAAEEANIEGLGSLIDFDPHDVDERPSEPGIYVLYDVSERPIYVGEGQNVKKRLRDHEDKFWFKKPIVDNASWIKVDDGILRKQIEEILIKFLKSNAVINKQHVER